MVRIAERASAWDLRKERGGHVESKLRRVGRIQTRLHQVCGRWPQQHSTILSMTIGMDGTFTGLLAFICVLHFLY